MRIIIWTYTLFIYGVLLSGCAASAVVNPTPVPLPTLQPVATATPNDAALRSNVDLARIDASTEQLRIEATATANAMALNAQAQQQQAIIAATQQAQAAADQRIAQATQQAIQATEQAYQRQAQAAADERRHEAQTLAQQAQAAAAAALANRDVVWGVSLAVVLLGAIACAAYFVRRRSVVDLAQVHTGNYLPKPVTTIGKGGITRHYAPPPQWDMAPAPPPVDYGRLIGDYLAQREIDELSKRTLEKWEIIRATADWSTEAPDVDTGHWIGVAVVNGKPRAYLLPEKPHQLTG